MIRPYLRWSREGKSWLLTLDTLTYTLTIAGRLGDLRTYAEALHLGAGETYRGSACDAELRRAEESMPHLALRGGSVRQVSKVRKAVLHG